MAQPLVSIVIITYNGWNVVKDCITSLKESSYTNYEILVLDNASTDGTSQLLKKTFPKVKLVLNKTNQGYVGLNAAIPHCKGKYVMFMNNDTTVNKDCIKLLVEALEQDEKVACAVPTLINHFNRSLKSGGTWMSRSLYGGHLPKTNQTGVQEIPYMGVGMIKKSIIKQFGYLFDPDYFIYAEDLDLGLRIRLLDMKTVMVFDAINYHMHALTMSQISTPARNTFLLERNILITFFKMFQKRTMVWMLPYIMLVHGASILKDIVLLRWKNAWARKKAWFWIIGHWPSIMKKRRAVQNLRRTSDAEILQIAREDRSFKKPVLV